MKVDTSVLMKRHPHKESLYRQFKEHIRGAITSGFYKPEERIESEREFIEAGKISYPTVSRALRELAEEGWLVRKIGSGTFVAANPPSVQSTLKTIAVFYYQTDTPYYEAIFEGVAVECMRHGITPVRVATGMSQESEREVVRHLQERKIDGALGLPMGSIGLMQDLAELSHQGFPIVLLGLHFEQVPCDAVTPDAEEATREVTRHLLSLGHRKILFLGMQPRYPFSTRHAGILKGIKERLAEAGMDESQMDEFHLPPVYDETDKEWRTALLARFTGGSGAAPTAVICEADGLARYLYGILQEAGMRIPNDVSVVGFGDLTRALHPTPPLTSTAWPLRRIGEHGVRLAISRVANPQRTPIRIVLEAPLELRESTGPMRMG